MIFTYFHKAVSIQYILLIDNFVNTGAIPTHYKTDYSSICHPGVFHFRARAVIMRNRVPLSIFPNVAQDYFKASLCTYKGMSWSIMLHLQHIKCLDSSNFVLYFVKHSFKPPRLSYNPWYRVCNGRSQIWDLISLSFQPSLSKYMLLKF